MGSRRKHLYNFRIFACLLIAFLTIPGWKFTSGSNDAGFLSIKSSDFTFNGNFGNSVYATDNGSNGNKIYFGVSSYVYGVTRYGNGINTEYSSRAVQNHVNSRLDGVQLNNSPIGGSVEETINALYKNWSSALASIRGAKNREVKDNFLNFEPVTTVKFLVKITRFVKLSMQNKDGRKTYNITKGKLTQGLYNIKVDNTNITRSIYYYKLETDEGTVTKKWYC